MFFKRSGTAILDEELCGLAAHPINGRQVCLRSFLRPREFTIFLIHHPDKEYLQQRAHN